MKFLMIIIIAAGGYYFYNNHKEKSDAYNEYTSKSGNASKSSSGSDFKDIDNSPSSYKGLSKTATISKAITEVNALHNSYNSQISSAVRSQNTAIKPLVDSFVKKYVKALGRAYNASSGSNKAALKTLKTFVVNWYQRMSHIEKECNKLIEVFRYGSSGNLSTMQATNRHALTELAKLIKSDDHYVNTFTRNYYASIKKHSISNTDIKRYAKDMTQSFTKVSNKRLALNKSIQTLVDKVYAFNSFVLRNSKNGYISVNNRGKYDALKRILSEIQAAESSYKSTKAMYYDSY